MKKSEGFCFDDWFDSLKFQVLDRTGVQYRDTESVMGDYEDDKTVEDVADEIAAEYGEEE